MGVKGLFTFVKNNPELLSDHKLHDCRVVIDGNNFMFYLYFNSKVPFIFGGDYDQYAQECKKCLNTLKACHVAPYVVFDGGYDIDDSKLPTVLDRRHRKIFRVDGICSGRDELFLPILAIETFQQILEELDIPHVSCQFEADREIAVLAHRWRCPVLSSDTDFFVYGLEGGVIPFEYIGSDTITGETLKVDLPNGLKYIPVKLYKYTTFACKYPQKLRHLVLPAFASLLGNDFVDGELLSKFYDGFYWPSGKTTKFKTRYEYSTRRLYKSLIWLDSIQSESNLFQAVLKYIPEDVRQEVGIKLDRSVNNYCCIDNFASIDLEQFFKCYNVPKQVRNLESFVFPELRDFYGKTIPDWIVSALRCCKMSHKIQNAIVLHRVFQDCQIELLCKQSTYICSKRIRRVFYGLFLPHQTSGLAEQKPSRESHIVEFDRNQKEIEQFYIPPFKTHGGQIRFNKWNINMTPDESNKGIRLHILLGAVNSTDYSIPDTQNFSNTIQLLIFMLAMWIKEADPKLSKGALMSLLTTILYLNARAFLETAAENNMKPCIIDDVEEACNQSEVKEVKYFVDKMKQFTRKLDNQTLTQDDCQKVHGFSQFQAILKDTIMLNQVLASPVPMLSPCFLFSGTTVHSLCVELDCESEPKLRIGELMLEKTPLFKMFTSIHDTVMTIFTQHEEAQTEQKKTAIGLRQTEQK